MKRILAALALCILFAVPALAADGKHELAILGEFVSSNTDGENPWTLNMHLFVPVGSGHIVLGPDVAIGSVDDLNRLGAGLDWNFAGQKSMTPFIGASAFYFQKDTDGLDRYTVTARAGFKVNVGKGAAIQLNAFQIVDGRGADESDMGAAAGIIARF